ncbi:MAG: flavin reductase family protein [Candidatus Thorarchaeota archaeon]
MDKIKLDANISPIPMPVTIIGANINDNPNFMALAWVTRVNMRPSMWGITMNQRHHTAIGIKQNNTFSVNVPNTDLMKETDFCGIISGRKYDKSSLFEVFYGDLKTAPMINECPVNIECKLLQTIELPTHYFFIGEIVNVYSREKYVTENKLDAKKINPLILSMPQNKYWSLGDQLGEAWKIGRELKKDEVKKKR